MIFIIFLCLLTQAEIIQTITLQCECVHIRDQENCKNSAKCNWNQMEERCIQATEFSIETLVTTYCAQFAEEECIQDKKCAFYLGKCIEFVSCEVFMKEKCDQSSLQCISDGNKCISKGLCSDYLTQIACQKKNTLDKYCKWRKRDDKYYCEDVQDCRDLPVDIKVDNDCRKQIEICTVSLKGGCEISKNLCNQYTQKEQCYFNLDQIECFWDDNINICLEYFCTNKQSSHFEECQKIDPNCTTNGHRCIKKLDCDQYQNSNSCVEDINGNKCIYYKGKCYQKNCINAPNFINNMIECQAFQIKDIICVPKKIGGCIISPQQCQELETEDSCLSIKELDGKQCFWQEQQKVCKIKQCSDAPLQYNHIDCINWLDDYLCIRGIDNGCIDNVDDCTKILNLQSCVKDKLNRKCMIENGQCVEEKCQNLQFPFYDNIFACENKLNICTFSQYIKTCINKECSQLEDRQCNFDYNMNKCIQLPGCIHKKCESASVYYGTHEECESWDIRCTINKGIINQIPYRNGCITKHLDCTDFKYEIQCITSLQGIPCFWNQINNQCEFHNCNNAPLSLQTLVDCQKWVQYHNIKCINKQNGGCIQQATNCQGLNDQVQCLNGSLSGLCFWNVIINKCVDRTCDNASNVTTNQQCRQWLSSCIFKLPNKCQSDNSNSILCSNYPKTYTFISHDECQAWNPNCTLKFGNACYSEDLCSYYKTENECNYLQKTKNCQWNASVCQIKQCSSMTSPSNDNDCKQYSPSCTYNQITTTITNNDNTVSTTINHVCITRQTTCSSIVDQTQCNNDSLTQKCQWDNSQCSAVTCINYESNQNVDMCKNRQFNCIYNSSTQKCEMLQDFCSSITDISYQGCQNSSIYCILNELSNKCVQIQNCSETTTYQEFDCNSIYKFCQSKNFTSGCQNLALNCSDYKIQQNCKINIKKQQCYWSASQNKCIDFSCSKIEEILTTHNQCQQFSSDCTINLDINIPSSCMNLRFCQEYLKKEQCFIDQNKQYCSWINQECINDYNKSAQLGVYTLQNCQEQYGIRSTINEDRSGCIIKFENCHQYNKFQCLTPNQTNINEVLCFWDQLNNECKEVLCHKANQQTRQLIECEQFHQNCQTKICKISICNDYKYDLDSNCQIALKNHQCTTDGTQCVERGLCSDVINRAGCTFSINYQDCIWLEDENRCVDKTCNSALNSMKTHQQCQDYLQQCTNKIEGGCINITTCYSILSPEGCLYDQNLEKCIWDYYNKKCIYVQCQSFCGDGVVGNDELCDDGNILPYDGCYKCKFQCQYGCNSCKKLNCYECNQGFELNQNGLCSEICGDGLIVGQEECDDMNIIQNDGCYDCRFQCHEQCLDCIFGICNKCAYGWEEYNTQCRTVCGNGLLVEQFEQCDDGNIDDDDGCNSKCQIEKDWICFQSQITKISECKKISYPKIILKNISQKRDSQQIIKLQFNQQVQLISDLRFEDFIKINVTNNVDFLLVIQPINEASLSLKNVEYTFHITLLEKVDYPQVSIQFIKSILINQYKQELNKQIDTISLGTPLIFSLDQYSRLNNTIAFNEIMIYVFIGSSSLSVLMGNLDLFFNMLTLLQQLSYVRYLSVPFPSHLDQYLKVFKVVSFQPLYDQLKIDYLFQKLNFGKPPFIKSKNNQKQDTEFINSFFLINAKSFYLTMFLSIFFYLLARIINKLNQYIFSIILRVHKFKQLKVLNKIFKSVRQFTLKSSNYFIYSGLIKVFISSEYQLMYSAYSQFPEYKFNFEMENLFETFNSFNALICMIIPHIFLFKSVIVLQKQYKSESGNKYSIFYENFKPDYWSRFFIPFSMIKVSIYMAIICFLYNSAIIQSISLIILCYFYCYYLIAIQPLCQKIEQLRLLIREITFLSIISSIFPYCLDFNDDVINILGWIHIGLFSFIIGSNIILDSVKQILDLRLSYRRNQIKIKRSQQRQYIINGLQQFIKIDNSYKNIRNGSLSIGYEVQSNQQSQILSLR
ncbi:unnamed protein product [Paramecium pentaurelia]|uniref:PSI domain-containing protein n=1 Tax=Paramecium pentaurelia TaxID=43138 RepID=A0A8S1S368_9CILI|nr:unnamed protein product [Paramecium pentaurelia]